MFHESGEESLEQGHVGVAVLGLGGCGISSVVLLLPLPPVGCWHLLIPLHRPLSAETKHCVQNQLFEHLRQPLPAPSTSLPRHVKCE